MKTIKTFEEFVNESYEINEKVYQLTGMLGAKGIPGKVLFNFKKQIEKIKYTGDQDATLKEVNEIWKKWSIKEGSNIILNEINKVVKSQESLVYITATLDEYTWKADTINGLNKEGSDSLYISLQREFMINIGFMDDIDANKYSKKLGGWVNNALYSSKDSTLYGKYDELTGENNNIEISRGLFLVIDGK